MKDVIKGVSDIIEKNKDSFFLSWDGVVFDLAHEFIRYDCVYLNVVYWFNGPKYKRLVPALAKGFSGQNIMYSRDNVIRVTSGTRRGRVIQRRHRRDSENFTVAGLHRRLVVESRSPDAFSLTRRGDRQLKGLLGSLVDGPYIEATMDETIPDFFLTTPVGKGIPSLRQTEESDEYLRTFPGYSSEFTTSENIRNLREHITTGGIHRDGWPFEHFQGRGVIAVSPWDNFGDWFEVPSLNTKKKSVHVDWSEGE